MVVVYLLVFLKKIEITHMKGKKKDWRDNLAGHCKIGDCLAEAYFLLAQWDERGMGGREYDLIKTKNLNISISISVYFFPLQCTHTEIYQGYYNW
jgi:hypothetical protein